jgi:hypothetical protein
MPSDEDGGVKIALQITQAFGDSFQLLQTGCKSGSKWCHASNMVQKATLCCCTA